jgi:hypothetical protein
MKQTHSHSKTEQRWLEAIALLEQGWRTVQKFISLAIFTCHCRSMKLGMEFIVPYIKDKSTWPLKPDVMWWDQWPVRHPSLLFAGIKFKNPEYLQIWQGLEADPKIFEAIRDEDQPTDTE